MRGAGSGAGGGRVQTSDRFRDRGTVSAWRCHGVCVRGRAVAARVRRPGVSVMVRVRLITQEVSPFYHEMNTRSDTSQLSVSHLEWQDCRAALDRGQLLPCRSQRNGDCVDRRANSGLCRRRRLRRGAGAEAASPLAAHLSQRGERVAEGAAVQATRGRRGMRRQRRRCCCCGGRHGLGLP